MVRLALQQSPTRPQPTGTTWLDAALLTGVLLASLEMAIVNAVLPGVAVTLRDAGLLPWVSTGYIAASTLATPLFGMAADRYGRRRAYAWGMGFLLAGSLLAAAASSMTWLLVGRIVQGVGGGALMPVTIVILGDRYDVAQRARMFGHVSLVWGLSTLMGPLVGAALTRWWGWPAVFWINLLPGGLALWGVWRLLGDDAVAPDRALAWRVRGLFTSPTQQLLNLCGALAVASMYGILAYVAVWVQGVHKGSATASGMALLPLSLAWTLGSASSGRLVPRLGLARLIRGGHLLLACGLLAAWQWPFAPPGLLLIGLGMGTLVTCCNLAIQELAPPERKGIATSSAIFLRNLAATAMVPLCGWVAGFRPGHQDLSQIAGLASGLQAVLATCAGTGMVALLLVWLGLPRRLALGHG